MLNQLTLGFVISALVIGCTAVDAQKALQAATGERAAALRGPTSLGTSGSEPLIPEPVIAEYPKSGTTYVPSRITFTLNVPATGYYLLTAYSHVYANVGYYSPGSHLVAVQANGKTLAVQRGISGAYSINHHNVATAVVKLGKGSHQMVAKVQTAADAGEVDGYAPGFTPKKLTFSVIRVQ